MDHHCLDIKPRHREIYLMTGPAYRPSSISQYRAQVGVLKLHVGKLQTRLNLLICRVMHSDHVGALARPGANRQNDDSDRKGTQKTGAFHGQGLLPFLVLMPKHKKW